MDNNDILGLMKTQQSAYLTAFEEGYRKGWDDACKKAIVLFNQRKRNHKKQETASERT
jgi:hypothetical protein